MMVPGQKAKVRITEIKNGKPDPEVIIAEATGLVSPPQVCVKLYKLIHQSNSTAQSIGDTLQMDPNLVARLLKIVNSAAYNFQSQIFTVSHAVMILGTEALCNLVMAIAAVRTVSKFDNSIYTMDEFWHHSVFVGLCSRHLAEECELLEPDSYFVAGLLHDIGIPIIYSLHPELTEAVNDACKGNELKMAHYEQEHFGFDHGDIGGRLLESWHLPDTLVKAITNHHHCDTATASSVLHLADLLASFADDKGTCLNDLLYEDEHHAIDVLSLKPNSFDFNKLVKEVNEERETVLAALFGS